MFQVFTYAEKLYTICYIYLIIVEKVLEKLSKLQEENNIEVVSKTSRISIDLELTRKMTYVKIAAANRLLWYQFFKSFQPFGRVEWNETGTFCKICKIFKIPFQFVLTLIIPVVDYELDRHGWSKLLNCLQFIFSPILVIFIMSEY